MSFVTSTQEGPILTLTLNRPEALNALNAQVLDDLDAALDAVDLNTVRCLIFTGTGDKAFAEQFEARYGRLSPDYDADRMNLGLERIPADIRFNFKR